MCVCNLHIKLITFSSIGKTIIMQFINQRNEAEVNTEDFFPIIGKNQ